MGRCAIVTAEMKGWLCGTGSFVSRVNSSALASFVALAVSSPKAKEFLEENAIGVTLKNLNQQVLGDLEIPLPPLEEQRRIVGEIEGYQQEIARLESEIAANRERIQQTISAVWNGDSDSAKGASSSQHGATPHVPDPKPAKG